MDRYLVVHNRSAHSNAAWYVVDLISIASVGHGKVIATCPSEAMAIEACNSLNNTNRSQPLEGVKP